MSLGQFGASLLKGYMQGKQTKTIADQDKKEKDARLKLYEVQLEREKAAQQMQQIQAQQLEQQLGAQRDAFAKLRGGEILPGTGVELLDPTAKRMSLTDLLADPEGSVELLRSGLVSGKDLLAEQRLGGQQAALQKFMEQFGGGGQAQGPGGMELAGVEFDSSRGPQFSFEPRQKMDLERAKLELEQLKLGTGRREEIKAITDEIKTRMSSERGLNRSLEHIREAAELNRRLAPTLLRSGVTFQAARRAASSGIADVKELFGVDSAAARQVVADFDRFNKLTSELIVSAFDRVGGQGVGSLTNDKMNLLRQSMGGVGADPGANALIFADTIEQLIDSAEIEGFEVDDANELLELAQQLRQPSTAAEQPPAPLEPFFETTKEAAASVKEIARMSLKQLQEIDPAALSQEALEAARRRYDELRKR